MTDRQLETLTRELQSLEITEAHDGDCVGADTQFHNLVRRLFPDAKVVAQPGFVESYPPRANNGCDEVRGFPKAVHLNGIVPSSLKSI